LLSATGSAHHGPERIFTSLKRAMSGAQRKCPLRKRAKTGHLGKLHRGPANFGQQPT